MRLAIRVASLAFPAAFATFAVVGSSACNSLLGTEAAEPLDAAADVLPKPTADADAASDAGSTCPSGDLSTNSEHCGRCGHTCLGGACAGGVCQPVVLATDLQNAGDVLRFGNYVYLTQAGTSDKSLADGQVTRIQLDGCAKDCASTYASLPAAVSLAANKDALYALAQLPNNGSVKRALFTDGVMTTFSANQARPRRILVDSTAVYWVNQGLQEKSGTIYRAFADEATGGLPIVSGLNYPSGIAINGTTLYFTEGGLIDFDGAVYKSDVTGQNKVLVASSQAQPRAIVTDSTYVYWVNMGNGTVHRKLTSGSAKDDVVMSGENQPVAIALDADHIYVTCVGTLPDQLDGRLRAADRDGKNAVTLASNLKAAIGIAMDDVSVFVLERGTLDKGRRDGRLLRVAKP